MIMSDSYYIVTLHAQPQQLGSGYNFDHFKLRKKYLVSNHAGMFDMYVQKNQEFWTCNRRGYDPIVHSTIQKQSSYQSCKIWLNN